MTKTTRPVIPVPATPIITPRLLLRPLKQSDLEGFHSLRTQIDVMKWTSKGAIDADKEVTQVWMDRFLPPNDSTTFNFAIEELANPGFVIGCLGCHISEPPECGYMLRKEFWGKGFATEAFERWVDVWWELPRREVTIEGPEPQSADPDLVVSEVLRADIDGKNFASARILAKCGFKVVLEKAVEHKGETINLILLEMPRPT